MKDRHLVLLSMFSSAAVVMWWVAPCLIKNIWVAPLRHKRNGSVLYIFQSKNVYYFIVYFPICNHVCVDLPIPKMSCPLPKTNCPLPKLTSAPPRKKKIFFHFNIWNNSNISAALMFYIPFISVLLIKCDVFSMDGCVKACTDHEYEAKTWHRELSPQTRFRSMSVCSSWYVFSCCHFNDFSWFIDLTANFMLKKCHSHTDE